MDIDRLPAWYNNSADMSHPTILNNRYHLQSELGSGGMAVVYRARDLMLERDVAVKVLRELYSVDPDFRHQFREEAKAVASLSHPNIVTIHDFGLHEEHLFIVMEFVSGTDLKAIFKQRGRLDIGEAVSLLHQAAEGIGFAHDAGLVHCDIKPQNLLVAPSGRLKVVDFGIARALATIVPDEQSEVVWGTPKYFSPEQAGGVPPTPASDVYALGIVLYEALTGAVPFQADSVEELARLHQETLPKSPRELNPRVPASLEGITLRAMAKAPAARFANANELASALNDFNGGYEREAGGVGDQPRGSRMVMDSVAVDQQDLEPVLPATEISSKAGDPPEPQGVQRAARDRLGFDLVTWLLALLALIFVGGLIPFWLWVYFFLNPPG